MNRPSTVPLEKTAACGLAGLFMVVSAFGAKPQATEAQVAEAPFTVLGLEPNRATLADAEKALGTAKPGAVDDHGHDFQALCYRGKTGTLVLEESFFEPKTIGRFFFTAEKKLPNAFAKLQCAKSPALDAPVRTKNGLGLDVLAEELTKALGEPTGKTAKEWTWDWSHYHGYTEAEQAQKPVAPGGGKYKGYYKYLTVKSALRKGRVTTLDVSFSGESNW